MSPLNPVDGLSTKQREAETASWQTANVAAESAKAAAEACVSEIRAAELAATKAKTQLASVVAQLVGAPAPTTAGYAALNSVA